MPNVYDVICNLKQCKNQTKEVPELLDLVSKYPEFPIVAMVDSEIVADDTCCYWYASIDGDCRIDEVCVVRDKYGDMRTLQKSVDDDNDIFESIWDYDLEGIDLDSMKEEEIVRRMKAKIDTLPWQKAICVYVSLPDKPPFNEPFDPYGEGGE